MTTPLTPADPRRIGPYTTTARIAGGGQGTVYLAHTPDGPPAAVKVLSQAWAGDTAQRHRFAKELDAARRVAPFCTAAVLDADMDADMPYIAAEYVPGPTLREAVRDEGPRTGTALDRLAIATVTALTAIHEAGVVHRDLKPGNVILGPDGPRVIDFGIARVVDATQQTTSVAGTPAYMSPEQVRGAQLGPACDMFSWAAVMAYAATGRHAFSGDNTMAVLHRVLAEQPDLHGVPERLLPLLQRCLDKDPDSRPSAAEVLGMLLGRGPMPQAPTLVLEEACSAVLADTARIQLPPDGHTPSVLPAPTNTNPADRSAHPGKDTAADTAGPGPWNPAAPGGGHPGTAVFPPRPRRSDDPVRPAPPPGPPPSPAAQPPPRGRRSRTSRNRPRSVWKSAAAVAVFGLMAGFLYLALSGGLPAQVFPAGGIDLPAQDVEEAPAENTPAEQGSVEEGSPAGPRSSEHDDEEPGAVDESGEPADGPTADACRANPHAPGCGPSSSPGDGCEHGSCESPRTEQPETEQPQQPDPETGGEEPAPAPEEPPAPQPEDPGTPAPAPDTADPGTTPPAESP
ncbi:protein kinase domain-containing protein [Nocardiopsis algeriensis]|uniref:non-specific serine/threonine protein kinase n=1 Tax=Nocardiopsis algeriensis TaxID=1478215 RepID=A0A841IMJ8_9ACTN|nr:protein kinase [Nocardiopsis algeriensis]MBB6119883.1 serine/threonine protein kinase [Nocardiopsis algeriensis]